MMKLTQEQKIAILEQKLLMWEQAKYDAVINGKIAQALNDEKMLEASKTRLGEIYKTVEILEQLIEDEQAGEGVVVPS